MKTPARTAPAESPIEALHLQAALLTAEERAREEHAAAQQAGAELARVQQDLAAERAGRAADAERFRETLERFRVAADEAVASEQGAAAQLGTDLREAHDALDGLHAELEQSRQEAAQSRSALEDAEVQARAARADHAKALRCARRGVCRCRAAAGATEIVQAMILAAPRRGERDRSGRRLPLPADARHVDARTRTETISHPVGRRALAAVPAPADTSRGRRRHRGPRHADARRRPRPSEEDGGGDAGDLVQPGSGGAVARLRADRRDRGHARGARAPRPSPGRSQARRPRRLPEPRVKARGGARRPRPRLAAGGRRSGACRALAGQRQRAGAGGASVRAGGHGWPRRPDPPDRGRAWIAEVEWSHAEGVARFRVLAADAEGTAVTIAESVPLDWPPSGPKSVQAMSRAADELEAAMLAAGWKPLPPGEAWYAKRFAWPRAAAPRRAPVAAPAVPGPEPAAPAVTAEDAAFELGRRFARVPWPEGAEQLWRCEIRWHAGYRRSRFEAVALEPARRRGQPIGRSATFQVADDGRPDSAGVPGRRGRADGLARVGRLGTDRGRGGLVLAPLRLASRLPTGPARRRTRFRSGGQAVIDQGEVMHEEEGLAASGGVTRGRMLRGLVGGALVAGGVAVGARRGAEDVHAAGSHEMDARIGSFYLQLEQIQVAFYDDGARGAQAQRRAARPRGGRARAGAASRRVLRRLVEGRGGGGAAHELRRQAPQPRELPRRRDRARGGRIAAYIGQAANLTREAIAAVGDARLGRGAAGAWLRDLAGVSTRRRARPTRRAKRRRRPREPARQGVPAMSELDTASDVDRDEALTEAIARLCGCTRAGFLRGAALGGAAHAGGARAPGRGRGGDHRRRRS